MERRWGCRLAWPDSEDSFLRAAGTPELGSHCVLAAHVLVGSTSRRRGYLAKFVCFFAVADTGSRRWFAAAPAGSQSYKEVGVLVASAPMKVPLASPGAQSPAAVGVHRTESATAALRVPSNLL